MLNVPAYLERIRYVGPLPPTLETLRSLHRAHMLAVPFENLDIGIGREIVCEEGRFLHKIVNARRGGFCYELNGAFAALLRALGFQVTLLSARVSREDGSDGPDFDHLALCVDVNEPGPDEPGPESRLGTWLADVGFGDSFVEPLRLASGLEQEQRDRAYRLTAQGNGFCIEAKTLDTKAPAANHKEGWKRQYAFTLQPRQLAEFAPRCGYHQTSPESHFTQNRICSLATPEGRITLSNGKLIQTRNGVQEERELHGEGEWLSILRDQFGIVLP